MSSVLQLRLPDHARGVSVLITLFFLISLLFLSSCGKNDPTTAAARSAAPPVVVSEVREQPVPLEVRAIGNVEAFASVEVKAQVPGMISRVLFEEGQDVRQGQPLFEIDPRDFEQAVYEAEAQLASARAALGQVEANHERDQAEARNAQSQADRYAGLAAKGIVSRDQNDQFQTRAVAAEKGAAATAAQIQSARAAVLGAEARLANAKLRLSYARVPAPMAGRTGNILVKAGNLVPPNANTPLVTINQISPAYATFSVPEQALVQLRRYATGGRLTVQAFPQEPGAPSVQGVLDFLDNQIDPATGTIRLKARFANQNRHLWPGQFLNVAIRLAVPHEIVIPTAAVRSAQSGNFVFVVKSDATAEQRAIETSRTWEEMTVVSQGLSAGEQVIIDGQLRVKPGGKVQVVQPRPSGGPEALKPVAGD